MTKYYKSVRAAILQVLGVFNDYTPVWSANVPMSNGVTDLTNCATSIDKQSAIQTIKTQGFTKNKRDKKRRMANQALTVSEQISAFASDSNNPSLFGEMKFSFTELFYGSTADAIQFAENIYIAAIALPLATLTEYHISPAILRSTIDSFIEVSQSPRKQIIIKKSATDSFKPLFDRCRDILDNRLMNLMSTYRESNPDFYMQTVLAKKVLDSTRHTTIEGVVTDMNGVDIRDCKVIITSAETPEMFEDMTSTQGTFKQMISPEFDYNVTFEIPNYHPLTLAVNDLKPGGHQRLKVKLRKIA